MSDFDTRLKTLLSEEDEAFITDTIDEAGYYKTAFSSLQGKGSGLRIGVWIGVFVACAILFFCLWQIFHVDSVREQIIYASVAVMANSAQIAFKMWFNMQLNRRLIIQEIKRLQLALSRAAI